MKDKIEQDVDKSNCAVLGNLDSLYVARVMRERAEQILRGQPGYEDEQGEG